MEVHDSPKEAGGGASPAGPHYYIGNGVRRAVAARESNVRTILAIFKEPGKADRIVLVPLDQLHSPKLSISASDPRFRRARQGMSTPAGRAKIPPIEIEPLGSPGQTRAIPLKDVQLDP